MYYPLALPALQHTHNSHFTLHSSCLPQQLPLMAPPPPKFFSLLFLFSLILFSLQAHARDSQFFSNNVKESELPNYNNYYNFEKQGMSNARFLNGRYYYDRSGESNYNQNQYGNP
ncbi:hypothetical protein C1H46_025476 [Malus baccata]|uniref:Uncharacterized protein n=1 Tax=Malus baccata TaxID=106549 RepID=A0A540LRM1_MALBA|nr:hypothetical protein C1H46_025476 [Malus baccata]